MTYWSIPALYQILTLKFLSWNFGAPFWPSYTWHLRAYSFPDKLCLFSAPFILGDPWWCNNQTSYSLVSVCHLISIWSQARARAFYTGDQLPRVSKALLKGGQFYYLWFFFCFFAFCCSVSWHVVSIVTIGSNITFAVMLISPQTPSHSPWVDVHP